MLYYCFLLSSYFSLSLPRIQAVDQPTSVLELTNMVTAAEATEPSETDRCTY